MGGADSGMNRTTAAQIAPLGATDRTVAGRVLLACPDAAARRRVESLLRDAGLDVATAADGEAAVRQALQSSYDVLLLDAGLPPVDGATLIELLQAVGYESPILALTVEGVRQTEEDGGYAASVPRDADAAELVRRVTRWLPAAPKSAWGSAGAWRDTDAFRELVADFVGELPATAACLRDAAARGDLELVAGIAHRIKGTAGNLMLDGLSAAAAALQESARSAGDTGGTRLSSAFAALDRELAALEVAP